MPSPYTQRWRRYELRSFALGGDLYSLDMSFDQIAAEALRMPTRERTLLASSLWESLEDPFEIAGVVDDADARALAIERDRRLESGEAKPISHEELMRRLRR